MRTLRLAAPRVRDQAVHFEFTVEPGTDLYRSTSFHLEFPPSVDPSLLPERILWLVFLLCTHAHWPYLRPCRVILPIGLDPAEVETWRRLLDSYVWTLESLRGGRAVARTIEIEALGPRLPDLEPLPDLGRAGVAFSAGKDSLVHAGLLRELLPQPPLLVTTTAPLVDSLRDQETQRRREILDAFAERRDFDAVEVRSNWRAQWRNDFPPRAGYQVAVSETSDTLVYFAFLLAVAWTRGVTHLFVASEAEVQGNRLVDGRVAQHPHYMYSAATQRALARLIAPLGLRFGSLTWGLSSALLTRLLWTRYPDLVDYQYSCWKVIPGEAACNRCTQCLRLAYLALAGGGDPARAGFDLVRLLDEFEDWPQPTSSPDSGDPQDATRWSLRAPTAHAIATVPLSRLARALRTAGGGQYSAGRRRRALWRGLRLRQRAQWGRAMGRMNWHPAFTAWTDPLLRTGLERILGEFAPSEETDARFAGFAERSQALTTWIAEPLDSGDNGNVEDVA